MSTGGKYQSKRGASADAIADEPVRRAVRADLGLLEPLGATSRHLGRDLGVAAPQHGARELAVPRAVPGVGLLVSPTVRRERAASDRFDTRQPVGPYARLLAPPLESAGTKVGVGGRRRGHAWLRWASSEAAGPGARKDGRLGAHLQRRTARYGTGEALGMLGHRLGRATHPMRHTKEVCDTDGSLRPGAPRGRPASRSRTGARGVSPHDDTRTHREQ